MRILVFALLGLVASVFAWTSAAAADGSTAATGSGLLAATTNQALKSIKAAEAAGADVTGLVARFNEALSLQSQADSGDFAGCSSHDDCLVKSNDMMLAIVEDATALGNQATAKNEQANVMLFTVYVPAGSFMASLCIVIAYRTWQSRRQKRYQEMDIDQRSAR